jgi:hypothetical protein
MAALLLMIFAMFTWWEVVSGAFTREIVSFVISAFPTSSGSETPSPDSRLPVLAPAGCLKWTGPAWT